MRRVALVVAVLAVAGCASAPQWRYFTLDMSPSDGIEVPFNVELRQFQPAESLVRDAIRIQASPTRIEYYAYDRWAAGVDSLVRQKLNAEFGPVEPGRKTVVVSGTILAFDQVDLPEGAEAHVRLELTYRKPGVSLDEAPLLEGVYDVREPAQGANADAVAQALSRAMDRVAAEMAADMKKLSL